MAVRWVPALMVAALWWWAVLRMVLVPGQTGFVEGTMVAGGWGLSLLPVHVASASGRRPRSTRASRRRRSDAGSGPS
ncbi:hypothetical protein ACFYZ9_36020 [Streptomyces sp. NPDC001691]|uniref:hypothetical protein n=1 Tax=unclassified Streptomyces TaxID=2593676 RepID=UPI000DEB63C4|nr:hypothetical protein [Streptomyces sp. SDr-06]RCH64180.1 hypothetical protein DT019_34710 [Streptomyces sp. SDr-06]